MNQRTYKLSYGNSRIGCYALIFAVVFLLPTCATIPDVPQSRNDHVIEDLPFFPQEDYQCGPASLAAVLNHMGVYVKPDAIAKEIFSESARGTLNIDMVLYAERKGLSARQYKGTIEELKKSIDSGYPVIVLVDSGFFLFQRNHFMVVKGYNEHGVIVNSGKDQDKFIRERDFLKVWERADFWTLSIKPK